MKKISLVIGALPLALCFCLLTSEARLSNNNRRAVVLEAFHAIYPPADGGCVKTIPASGPNAKCVSNWNYLNDDYGKYSTVKSWYGCLSSGWAQPGDGCPANFTAASFFSNVASYGFGTFGGYYGPVGRGGQCKYFTNLILYRSGSHPYLLPRYSDMWTNVDMVLTNAKPGDILTTSPTRNPTHTTIVVEIKYDSFGKVKGLDVIDSNWVSDMGTTMQREVIGRHEMLLSDYQGQFGIWKGVSYYSEPYVP
jgi:hypothetical protein